MVRDCYDSLKSDILNRKFVRDGRLPSFRTLTRSYNCSVSTIKRTVDQLKKDGLLLTRPGSGTFLAAHDSRSHAPKTKVLGAVVVRDHFAGEINARKERLLRAGWFMSLYDAEQDAQAPERERLFLAMAHEQSFGGLRMTASPLEPTNDPLLQRLRREGVKIAHLSPYKSDMTGECAFLPDFRLAGMAFAARAGQTGYAHFQCLAHMSSPFVARGAEGLAWMGGLLGKPVPTTTHLPLDPSARDIADFLRTLAPGTALCCDTCNLARRALAIAGELGFSVPGRLGIAGLIDFSRDSENHSHFAFDDAGIVDDALAYLTDPERGPLEKGERLYPPAFVDRGTL